MKRSRYKSRERRWALYHAIEKKEKMRSLAGLSEDESVMILNELNRFVSSMGPKAAFDELDMAKIKALKRIHEIFGKTKK